MRSCGLGSISASLPLDSLGLHFRTGEIRLIGLKNQG
jgi:hypothetical protein